EGTLWIDVAVRCELTGEEERATVTCDEDEPECAADHAKHGWQSPLELVGGIAENPGVWGHGAASSSARCVCIVVASASRTRGRSVPTQESKASRACATSPENTPLGLRRSARSTR